MTIPKWLNPHLAQEDLKTIEDTIAQAELHTSGEIVPMIVLRSSAIRHVPILIFILLFCIWISLFEFFGHHLLQYNLNFLELITFAVGTFLLIPLSYILSSCSWTQRHFIHPLDRQNQSYQRALVEFYSAGLNKTNGSTGILLFISLTDHQVVVLADQGINNKMNDDTWTEVRDLMLSGLKTKNMTQGLAAAITKCGEILSVHFPAQSHNPNELHNKLIIKD